jgi:hypothetical protein
VQKPNQAVEVIARGVTARGKGLSDLARRIILASMAAVLSSVQVGKIWRVKIVWPNRHVNYFGKFTSERDVIDWVNAHSNLTKPFAKNTIDEPQQADRSC